MNSENILNMDMKLFSLGSYFCDVRVALNIKIFLNTWFVFIRG